MYAESSNNFTSAELMHYASSTNNENADYINNNLDYNSLTTTDYSIDYLEDDIFNIGHQALVNQQETEVDVTDYSETPFNNHTVENFHYTTPNQSQRAAASPHGYSENISPLLEPYTNNGTSYSVQSTPLLVSEPLPLEFSPLLNNSHVDLELFEHIVSTPYTVPYTPLITPITPYINTPYITNNSPYSVTSYQTPLLDTPVEPNADPNLYDDDNSSTWFNLFDPPNNFSTDILKSVPVKTSQHFYEEGNNIYQNQNVHNCILLENPIISMDTISPANVSIEKKEILHDSPKSEASTPITSVAPIATSPTSAAEAASKTVLEASNVAENNSGIIKTETITNLLSTHTPDSAPTTPVDTPKLVAIRPRPHDDEDSGENESTRRSKRQRTMSVSEENEEENDDEAEKKYNCPECGRGFNRKFNMQTHRATHDPNRVKPFACEHPNCGSRFTRKHDLKRHINGIHKGEKVHECTVCRKPFSRKDAWKRHIATCGKV